MDALGKTEGNSGLCTNAYTINLKATITPGLFMNAPLKEIPGIPTLDDFIILFIL